MFIRIQHARHLSGPSYGVYYIYPYYPAYVKPHNPDGFTRHFSTLNLHNAALGCDKQETPSNSPRGTFFGYLVYAYLLKGSVPYALKSQNDFYQPPSFIRRSDGCKIMTTSGMQETRLIHWGIL